MTPPAARRVIAILVDAGLSVRRACQVASLARAAYYRPLQDRHDRDAEIIAALTALVAELPLWGFGLCFLHLRNAGHRWNRKRLLRVYRQLRLHLPLRAKRRVPTRVRQPLDAPATLNRVWGVDFMSNQLYTVEGRVGLEGAPMRHTLSLAMHEFPHGFPTRQLG